MARPNEKGSSVITMPASPFVTVIMPVRNESSFIRRSLTAVTNQDYDHSRMEIIVVDGMSTDDTRELVRALACEHRNLRLIQNPGKIAPVGLNLALAEARGEIIIRVDGHCEIASDYVRRCVEHLLADGVDAVGGPIETVGETPIARIISLAMSSHFGVGGSSFRTLRDRSAFVDTVAFPGYTRKAIEKAGLFDEELVRNQDDEYNYRLRKLGGRILLSPDVRSRYYSRSSLRSLWSQYFQYGYWKVRVMQKHWRQLRVYQFAPALFAALLLLSLLLSPFSIFSRLIFALIVGSYALANVSASITVLEVKDWLKVPLLSFAFAILHLSFGFGFLYGLVYFRNRWRNDDRSPQLGQAAETPRRA